MTDEQLALFEPHTTTGLLHPQTSHLAAERFHLRSGTCRRRVLQALAGRDLTDEEMQMLRAMSANTQRPRRIELCRAGFVEATENRRRSYAGCWSVVWTITDTGRRALAREE